MSRPRMILCAISGAFTLLATSTSHGATPPAPVSAYQAGIDDLVQQAGLNGVALVRRDRRAVHGGAYGLAQLDPERANLIDTPFRIASVSKAFTATLIMDLVEDSLMDLNTPIADTLPGFDAPYARDLTLHHLLSHTSGIPNYPAFPGWLSGLARQDLSQQDMLDLIAGQELVAQPGTERHYSSANYYLAGVMIEAVTGRPFADVMQNRILSPLGLHDSGAYRSGHLPAGLAQNYQRVETPHEACPVMPLCPSGEVNLALFMGTGAMHATADDLARFVEALADGQILSEHSRQTLFESYGWSAGQIVGASGELVRVITADGALEGYAALLVHIPSDELSIVLLDNTGLSHDALVQLALGIIALDTTPSQH